MSEVLIVLKAARKKIALGWTRNALARNAQGDRMPPGHGSAVCWDIIGAVRAVSAPDTADERLAFNALRDGGAILSLSLWNDQLDRTWDEVLALFDQTIASLDAP